MINVFWFRRDLRLVDNTGLDMALSQDLPVLPIFIFDSNIVDELPKNDSRISFIYSMLKELNEYLHHRGSGVLVLKGDPLQVWSKLIKEYPISNVYVNRDYEPYANERDGLVERLLSENGIKLHSFKDQVIFEKDEIMKADGSPYVVFTPYKRRWLSEFSRYLLKSKGPLNRDNYYSGLFDLPSIHHLGFEQSAILVRPYDLSKANDYDELRNIPSADATSYLGPHLRFGTVSIRTVILKTENHATFLSELIWREFFMQILHHFPNVVSNNFKVKYDTIHWRNNPEEFEKWTQGTTGYPLVDAGMRELNATGYMHNRVRMVVAGFLCKHLLIDWKWGEAYFAKKLLDYELSSNNGNWQWAAGTGCDAAPYFRIFNPTEQIKKFDPEMVYVKKWVPEFDSLGYHTPMVEHKFARERAIKTYKEGLRL